jgi:molybdate transport system substrate-binding protein
MKRFISIFLLLGFFLAGCVPAATPVPTAVPATATEAPASEVVEPVTLNVFAASSLTAAFTEIGANFEAANPGVTVTLNFAGSQALRTQIEEGAPADVFASASGKEMDTAVEGKFVADGINQVFLSNQLVVILPVDNPAGLEKLKDLANPGIKIVLAAEEVPVGNYARQSLDLMNASFGADFKDKVLANVVSNEDNVKQVVSKIQLGEADAGIAYVSDIVASPDLKTIEIPTELNVIAKYPIAPLAASANAEVAQAFIDYVLSAEGQAVLQKWGFTPVK